METRVTNGRDAQRLGQLAEERFAGSVLRVLNIALADQPFKLIISHELDGAAKVDLRVLYIEPGAGSQTVKDFQVSMTPKSAREQRELQKRGIISVVINPNENELSDEQIDALVCSLLFPRCVPERYARYCLNAN